MLARLSKNLFLLLHKRATTLFHRCLHFEIWENFIIFLALRKIIFLSQIRCTISGDNHGRFCLVGGGRDGINTFIMLRYFSVHNSAAVSTS